MNKTDCIKQLLIIKMLMQSDSDSNNALISE